MITACLISSLIGTGESASDAKRPQVGDDYTLVNWRDASADGTLIVEANPKEMAVKVVCTHEVWDALVHDPEYAGKVLWYEEENKPRRVMGG